MGVVVRETTREMAMAAERVTANSRKRRPTTPPIKRMGMNTATRERLMESTVNPISRAPRRAASRGAIPASRWRVMFSSTTMASSMTKPVAMVSAMSERLFRLKPSRYITPKVPTKDTGTATAGMRVARRLRRNTKTTRVTRMTEMTRVRSTSWRDERMVVLRSRATLRSTAPGMAAWSWGRRPRTRSTVSMMLAPGCRKMTTTTAGFLLEKPAARTSSTESFTVATSVRCTARPPW